MPDVGEGYLVLADVSGYTGFLAGIELEHASGILAELIQEMLDGLTPPLELAGSRATRCSRTARPTSSTAARRCSS